MRLWTVPKGFCGLALTLAAVAGAGCQQGAVTTTNTTIATTNVAAANTSATTAPTTAGVTIETREPEKYSASVVVTGAATGQQAQQLPPILVARNGSDRRYSVNVPAVGEIIFLDKADKRYVIVPARKQYAELTAEMTGFEVPRSLTPGQMVAVLEKQQGVQRVGEETLNNRPVVKYKYAGRAQTGTQAGQVAGESFIYVDKETQLPLRIEGYGQSQGSVQGVSGGNVIIEMRDIKTDVDPTQFEVPTSFRKLTPEEVRQQTQALVSFLQLLVNAMSGQMGGTATPGGATPTTTATPAATASPTATR